MLHIHRAVRSDGLVAVLAEVLGRPPADPFAPEVVAVPTRGVERWLTQRLSHRLGAAEGRSDGVCANVTFPSPSALVAEAVAAAVAGGVARDADPWAPERVVWPLLRVVDEHLAEPWLRTLAAYLGVAEDGAVDPVDADRRFGAVRDLAGLFDRYAVQRPDMVRAWAEGRDTTGDGAALPDDVCWQPRLWRRLRAAVDQPSPAERSAQACARLREAPEVADLPERLAVFGLTRLPASALEVLRALAIGREVRLLLLHPSPALWDRIAAEPGPAAEGGGALRRRQDPTAAIARNPLVARWGRDVRELQLVLPRAGDATDVPAPAPEAVEVSRHAPTLLARLQADVRADRPPAGLGGDPAQDPRAPLDEGDRSVQVHACHGRARQVEVLRDAILHVLADDDTLEARDVIVMCPDIETYAPLVHATFGAAEAFAEDDDVPSAAPDRLPSLRVRLADRALRQTNPVLGVVARLLELVAGRVTASEVLDLAAREPVRRRFRLDDDALARVEGWVEATGIRWGLDAAHRAPYAMDRVTDGTWRAGLDRLLLGVALTEDPHHLPGGVLPFDDQSSTDIDLVGRVAELVDRLEDAVAALGRTQPVAAWAEAVAEAADALCATRDGDGWQRRQLARLLADVVDEAGVAAAEAVSALSPAELRDLLADRLRGRPSRANFRTGHLTVCTLHPMRSVPHRVVCLLGLDDGAFPRRAHPDGDDLVAADPQVGDRDPRSEDRQLLLDALMAAGDTLVITYAGRDERTNASRPPAVPVGELLDVIEATARPAVGGDGGARARDRVVVHHPLQPFDVRTFSTDASAAGRGRPWGFDPTALAGARALVGPRLPATGFLSRPLPSPAVEVVELDDLVRFAQEPVRAFLRQRLGMILRPGDVDPSDALPVTLDGLGQWAVGERLLALRRAGVGVREAAVMERARGLLPPGGLGDPVLERISDEVQAIAMAARQALTGAGLATTVEVDAALSDGVRVVGTVPGWHDHLLLAVTFSRVSARHRLAAWVRLLAITGTRPEQPVTAVTVGRRVWGNGATVATVTPPGGDPDTRRAWAVAQLEILRDLWTRGLAEPLPIYPRTSMAWAEARRAGRDDDGTVAAAEGAWASTWSLDKEDRDAAHLLVLEGRRGMAELLAQPPQADRGEASWPQAEATRFGAYARRLWDGLLAAEEVVHT